MTADERVKIRNALANLEEAWEYMHAEWCSLTYHAEQCVDFRQTIKLLESLLND